MYTTVDKGKFLPHKFLNLVRILLLPKCCAPPHMHLVHIITTKANNFLFHFELNQVYNNIRSNIRCFTFSRMNFQKLFFDFMNYMENKTKQKTVLLEFTYFLPEAFNDPVVILGSFNYLRQSSVHKANTLTSHFRFQMC